MRSITFPQVKWCGFFYWFEDHKPHNNHINCSVSFTRFIQFSTLSVSKHKPYKNITRNIKMLTVLVSRLWAEISSIPLVVLIDRDLSPREAIKQGMFNARSHTHSWLSTNGKVLWATLQVLPAKNKLFHVFCFIVCQTEQNAEGVLANIQKSLILSSFF